jgi:hypothetical protein
LPKIRCWAGRGLRNVIGVKKQHVLKPVVPSPGDMISFVKNEYLRFKADRVLWINGLLHYGEVLLMSEADSFREK